MSRFYLEKALQRVVTLRILVLKKLPVLGLGSSLPQLERDKELTGRRRKEKVLSRTDCAVWPCT
jgi:hypothetical protein